MHQQISQSTLTNFTNNLLNHKGNYGLDLMINALLNSVLGVCVLPVILTGFTIKIFLLSSILECRYFNSLPTLNTTVDRAGTQV